MTLPTERHSTYTISIHFGPHQSDRLIRILNISGTPFEAITIAQQHCDKISTPDNRALVVISENSTPITSRILSTRPQSG